MPEPATPPANTATIDRRELEQFFRQFAGQAPTERESTLLQENFKLRAQRRTLKNQLESYQSKAPPADAVVLKGDEAKEYQDFKKLNLTPAQITEKIKVGDEAATKLSARERADLLQSAATAAGYKPSVFERLVRSEGLHVEMKDVSEKDDDGKTVVKKVPHVRKAAEQNAALEPLTEFAERELAEFLPALQATEDDGESGSPAPTTKRSKAAEGVEFPATRTRAPSSASAKSAEEKTVDAAKASGLYSL